MEQEGSAKSHILSNKLFFDLHLNFHCNEVITAECVRLLFLSFFKTEIESLVIALFNSYNVHFQYKEYVSIFERAEGTLYKEIII